MAATDYSNLISLTPPPTDMSVAVLNVPFGIGWHKMLWSADGGTAIAEGAGGVIGTMLLAFNMVVLTMLVLYYIYFGTVALASGSTKGKLAEEHGSWWTPVRALVFVFMLAPIPWAQGYSIFQGVIFSAAYIGIGAADSVLKVSMEFVKKHLGVMTAPTISIESRDLTRNAMQSLTAQRFLVDYEGNFPPSQIWSTRWVASIRPPYEHSITGTIKEIWDNLGGAIEESAAWAWDDDVETENRHWQTGYWEFTFNPPTGEGHASLGLTQLSLGVITVPCQIVNTGADLSCFQRKAAVEAYLHELADAARRVVGTFRSVNRTDPPQAGAVSIPERDLVASLRNTAMSILDRNSPQIQERIGAVTDDISRLGWITLGAYHSAFAGFQSEVLESLQTNITSVPPELVQVRRAVLSPGLLDAALASVNEIVIYDGKWMDTDLREHAAAAGRGLDDAPLSGVWLFFSEGFQWIPDLLTEGWTSGDPIGGLSATGHAILNITEGVVATMVGVNIAKKFSSNIPFIGGDTKETNNLGIITVVLFTIIIPLLITAALMAYWLPLVPFMTWVMQVVAWFILLIEALVLSAVWAFASALPGGDGLTGRHGGAGWMLLMRVSFQPVLMVIGWFAAIVLLAAIAFPIGFLFKLHWAASSGGFMFVIGMLFNIIICYSVIIAIAHRIFNLPVYLADNGLRWIGGAVFGLHEEGDVQSQRQTLVAGAGAVIEAGAAPARTHKGAKERALASQLADQMKGGGEPSAKKPTGAEKHNTLGGTDNI